jgi:ABC-type sulfate transport system permease component
MRALRLKQPSVLPGFGLTLGFTLSYLGLIVLIPLGALVLGAAGAGLEAWQSLASPRVLAAFRVSFGTAFAAAAVNAVFGLIVAWVQATGRLADRPAVRSADRGRRHRADRALRRQRLAWPVP